MPPKEKKKGQKEINKDNKETLVFYWRFTGVASIIQVAHIIIWIWLLGFSLWSVFWVVFAGLHHAAAHWMMRNIASSELEINNSWVGEYSKDIIILISILQVMSALSNKLWLFWLLVPGYSFYKIWTLFLWPWFQAGSEPVGEERTGKEKGKKQKVKYMRGR